MHCKRGDTGTSPKAYGRVPGQRGDKIPDSVEPVLDSYWQSGIRAIRHRSGVLSVMAISHQLTVTTNSRAATPLHSHDFTSQTFWARTRDRFPARKSARQTSRETRLR